MANYMIVSGELYHHGIKGQRWGVRRYQNPDGTLTAAGRRRRLNNGDIVIEKGATIGHVTRNQKLKLSNKATYAYTNEDDAKIYRGTYAKYLRKGKNSDNKLGDQDNKVYAYTLKTKKELRIPSEDKMVKQFIDSMNENFEENYDFLISGAKRLAEAKVLSMDTYKGVFYPDDQNEHILACYDVFATYGLDSAITYNNRSKLADSFIKGLENQNYNAIIDTHNYRYYNGAKEPIIVLNGKKYLKQSGMSEVKVSEIEGNVDELIKKLGKVQY